MGSESVLPPFPVDDATLGMLEAALDPWSHGHPDAERSSLWDFLTLMSQMAGSDPTAVESIEDDGSDGGPRIVTMRDPIYTDHCVIQALIDEVRRLRDGA
jgi:hypothetical protein